MATAGKTTFGNRKIIIIALKNNKFDVKYNDPEFLKSQGYNATTLPWHINCLITYDNLKKNIVTKGSEARKWIELKKRKQ